MASYQELKALLTDSDLEEKVVGAVMVAADAINDEGIGVDNHDNRVKWAKAAFSDPAGTAKKLLPAILGANAAQSVANIQGASDASVLANVEAVIDTFADGT